MVIIFSKNEKQCWTWNPPNLCLSQTSRAIRKRASEGADITAFASAVGCRAVTMEFDCIKSEKLKSKPPLSASPASHAHPHYISTNKNSVDAFSFRWQTACIYLINNQLITLWWISQIILSTYVLSFGSQTVSHVQWQVVRFTWRKQIAMRSCPKSLNGINNLLISL